MKEKINVLINFYMNFKGEVDTLRMVEKYLTMIWMRIVSKPLRRLVPLVQEKKLKLQQKIKGTLKICL